MAQSNARPDTPQFSMDEILERLHRSYLVRGWSHQLWQEAAGRDIGVGHAAATSSGVNDGKAPLALWAWGAFPWSGG